MIYLDYNATTPICDAAREAMLPYLGRHFGNPSSVHAAGREARAAIDTARDKLAGLLGVKPNEIIFTSGGTEACNLAVLGLARWHRHLADHGPLRLGPSPGRRCHIVSNKAEHHAVLNAVEHLEKEEGFEVTWLNVSKNGIIDLDQLNESIRPETRLVSIMTANNETGVIQPIREISEICRKRGVLLHSDMVQSFGKTSGIGILPMEHRLKGDDTFDLSRVDAASFAAHKFYGPKGAGFLYLKSGISIQPILFGGAHENERRPGTENVAAIAGMAAAAEWMLRGNREEQEREKDLRDELWHRIVALFPDAKQNGDETQRLGNTLNVSFEGVDSETMLMALDVEGVCASSGSACMVGSVVASHVLLTMGLQTGRASSAVRFSLGKWTIADEITATGQIIEKITDRITKRKKAHAAA